jgi:hypothetical protein|tara:strand:+ start:1032 stop:1706 length:675 start_codon:yes stop_codon:yes gene_type:complete
MANGTSSNMNTGIMDPNIMRLYDPQQFASNFGFMLPQIPIIPEMPETPVIKEKGDGKPDQFDPGTFNPNLLGQYVGYFNPSFPAAPGATGSPQNINDFMSSTAPTSIVGDELSFTPIGTDIQQEDEDQFGLANLLSLSPTFSFITRAVPEILGKVFGGITDALNTKDTDPDDKPKTTPDPFMDVKEDYATDTKKTKSSKLADRAKAGELGEKEGPLGVGQYGGR